ncbi:Holliday junction branch migration protein RuvA [Weissella coleopterorum]|uniref:Holliday junction branch migration complex subunit RuvA n=1 Tax=Weissella coleopterorum TaxID=2714949 RepID=A0A6G8B223_9LACO|nr:Holliday junction branch migration protein RuvA [Weissella coleopterorum]QIL51275.1 Holliday junction branch migration protein RuvA [Weissella coleopterorum]
MYEYLNGLITVLAPKFIVVEVGGIGYRVIVGNPYAFEQNEQVKVYIEQILRQDEETLYGFKTASEKQLFEQLLAVSGIGPKSALAILANSDHTGLIQAIVSGDVNYLVKFPGIGKKTAQQIVLDLQNNLAKLPFDFDNIAGIEKPSPSNNKELDDALEALKALGYSARDVDKVAKKLIALEGLDTAGYVSAGLKLFN